MRLFRLTAAGLVLAVAGVFLPSAPLSAFYNGECTHGTVIGQYHSWGFDGHLFAAPTLDKNRHLQKISGLWTYIHTDYYYCGH